MDFPNSVIPDFLTPTPSEPLPTLSVGTGIVDLVQGPGYYASSQQSYDPIASLDFSKPASSSALAAPLGFDPVRTRLDRYQNSDYFQQLGFNPLEGYGNEYKYGSMQTWGDVWGNALGGAWKLAGNTYVEGWKGWGRIADAMTSWDASKLVGTPEELLAQSKIHEDIMNKYAIFSTPEADAGGIFNRKFFGDMVQQSGFALGAIGQFLTEELLTLGLSTQFSLAKLGLRAPAWIGKTVTKADVLADMAKTGEGLWTNKTWVENFVEGAKKFVPLAGTVNDISRYSRAGAGTLQLAAIGVGGARRFLAETNMAMTEARMEAAGTYGELYNNLFDEEVMRTGQMPGADRIQRMQELALDAAYDNFSVNSGILMLSNRLQFDNMFTKFNFGRKVLGESAGYADDVLSVAGKDLTKVYQKGKFGTMGLYGDIAKDFGKKRAAWEVSKSLGKNIFKWEASEGLQEISQDLSNRTLQNYYYELYHGAKDPSLSQSFKESARELNANNQGLKTFLMGALTGRLLSPINYAVGQAKLYGSTNPEQRKQRAADIKENVELINAFYKDPNKFLNEHIANVKVQDRVAKNIDEAIANRDQYAFHNAKTSGFAKTVSAAIKTGMFTPMMNMFKGFADTMDAKEFKEAFGMELTDENISSVKDFFTKASNSAKDFYERWNTLKDRYNDMVIPELYKEGTPERKIANAAKRALDDAIEMMATIDHKAKDAVQRANVLQQEIGRVENIGGSAEIASRILGDIATTQYERSQLLKEITNLESAEKPDAATKKLIKEKKKQLEALDAWITNYALLNQEDKDIRKLFKKTQFNKAFRDYVNAKNAEGKLEDVKVRQSDFNEIYEKFLDYMQLMNDYAEYIDAFNIISNPTQFIMMHDRMVEAILSTGEKMNEEHVQEAEVVSDEENPGGLAGLLETATEDDAQIDEPEDDVEKKEFNQEEFETELTDAYRDYVQKQKAEGADAANPSNFIRFSPTGVNILAKYGVNKSNVYAVPAGATAEQYEQVEFKFGTPPAAPATTTETPDEGSTVGGKLADSDVSVTVGSYTLNLGDKIIPGVEPELTIIGFNPDGTIKIVTQDQTVDVPKETILDVLNNGYAKLVKNPNKGQLPASEINRRDLSQNPRKTPDNGYIPNVAGLRASTLNQANRKDGIDAQLEKQNEGLADGRKAVNGYQKVNHRLEDFETRMNKQGKIVRDVTNINEEYPLVLATSKVAIGKNLMIRVDTEIDDFYEPDFIDSSKKTKRTKADFFDGNGKIKKEAVGTFPVAIYSVVDGKEIKLGYLPTQNWVDAQDLKGEPINIAKEIVVDGVVIPNWENNKTLIRQVRKQMMDEFNNKGIIEKGAVVSEKSDGRLRTSSSMSKLSEVFNPNSKLAIIKNGVPYITPDHSIDDGNLIMPGEVSEVFGNKERLEGWPMIMIPTPSGKTLVSWVSIPMLQDSHIDFVLESWKAFHTLVKQNKAGEKYDKKSEQYKIVQAVYKMYDNKLTDDEAPDFKILQDYWNDYITYTSPLQYDPLRSNTSQITVLPDGTLITWAVETGREEEDKLLIKTPSQLTQDNQDKFYNLAKLVYYNVKFDGRKGRKNNGINSNKKMEFLSVIGGKLVKSTPMTYNQYMFNILETNLAPGIPLDPADENSERIHFNNPVVNFEFTGVDKTSPAPKAAAQPAPVSDKTIEINSNRNRNKEQKNAGAPVLDGYSNGWFAYYTPEGPENRVSFKTQQEALDWIDSKYDAELAALEEPKPADTGSLADMLLGADFGEGLTDFGDFDPGLLDEFEGNKKSIATKIDTLRQDKKIRKDC